jgi:hypothetical protein
VRFLVGPGPKGVCTPETTRGLGKTRGTRMADVYQEFAKWADNLGEEILAASVDVDVATYQTKFPRPTKVMRRFLLNWPGRNLATS